MKREFKFPFEVVIILAVSLPHLYAALVPPASLMNWYRTDDAFYYFIVARNVAAGHGFTFDLMNRTNGFHPLWEFLIVPIFALSGTDRILPLRILLVVLAALNAATGVVIYRLLKKYFLFGTAALFSLIWVLLPAIHKVTNEDGLEAGLNAFALSVLLLGGSWFMDRVYSKKVNRWDLVIIGFLGAFAIFSRLDNIFTFVTVGCWLVLRKFPFPRYLIWDEVFVVVGIFGAAILRFGFSDYYEVALFATFLMVALALVIKPACYVVFGIYKENPGKNRAKEILRIVFAVTTASLVLGGIMLGLNSAGIFRAFPRLMIFYDWVITLILILCSRLILPQFFNEKTIQFPRAWLLWLQTRWRKIFGDGLKYFLPGTLLMLLYLGWNKIYFGTYSPISGQVKHWWSTLPNTVYGHPIDLKVFLSISPKANYGPWSLITSPLDGLISNILDRLGALTAPAYWGVIIVLIGLLVWGINSLFNKCKYDWQDRFKRIGLHALLIGCLLQISYYLATSYPNTRSWYWVGEMMFLVLFGAIIWEGLKLFLLKNKTRERIIFSVELLFMVVLLFVNIRYISSISPAKVRAGSEERYLADARGLEALTPAGSIIGMTGGGTVSYFINDRTIVNLDGLMNSSEYLHAMQTNQATEFLDRLMLTFVNANEYMVTSSDPYMGFLKERLEKVGLIKGSESFTLFIYKNPLLEGKSNP